MACTMRRKNGQGQTRRLRSGKVEAILPGVYKPGNYLGQFDSEYAANKALERAIQARLLGEDDQ